MNGSKAGGQPQPQSQPISVPTLTLPSNPAPQPDGGIQIIQPKWEPGDRIDYVPRGMSDSPSVMATSLGQGLIGGAFGTAAQKAQEERDGRRHRAVIDAVLPEGKYRIILSESLETIWADGAEVEPLGVIDRLADMVGPESRTLKDGLRALEDKEAREN